MTKGGFTHTMPSPCCSPAVLKTDSHIPCRSPAATLPLLCHSPRVLCFTLATASEIGMLLITNFLELGVASRQHAVNLPTPCRRDPATNVPRTCHGLERSLLKRHIRGMAGERHGNGMACVNQTRPHCVNQMGNTQSRALVERHGRGTAGERQGNGMVCMNRPLQRHRAVRPLKIKIPSKQFQQAALGGGI
jgi:hypothetical protein